MQTHTHGIIQMYTHTHAHMYKYSVPFIKIKLNTKRHSQVRKILVNFCEVLRCMKICIQ